MMGPVRAAAGRMTAAEFMRFEGEPDTRYELVDGEVRAMSAPKPAHATVVANASFEINSRLRDRPPCRSLVEAGIRYAADNHFSADVAVTCAPPDAADDFVMDPVLIVEVLSESTQAHDLGTKLPRYVELPAVEEIWFLDSRERRAQVWRRAGDTWIVTMPLRGDASFESAVLGDRVGLDALYRDTGL